MIIEFIEKNQNWKSQNTTYWFKVDGQEWGISATNGDRQLVDKNSYPIDDCNDHDSLKEKLLPLVEKHVND